MTAGPALPGPAGYPRAVDAEQLDPPRVWVTVEQLDSVRVWVDVQVFDADGQLADELVA